MLAQRALDVVDRLARGGRQGEVAFALDADRVALARLLVELRVALLAFAREQLGLGRQLLGLAQVPARARPRAVPAASASVLGASGGGSFFFGGGFGAGGAFTRIGLGLAVPAGPSAPPPSRGFAAFFAGAAFDRLLRGDLLRPEPSSPSPSWRAPSWRAPSSRRSSPGASSTAGFFAAALLRRGLLRRGLGDLPGRSLHGLLRARSPVFLVAAVFTAFFAGALDAAFLAVERCRARHRVVPFLGGGGLRRTAPDRQLADPPPVRQGSGRVGSVAGARATNQSMGGGSLGAHRYTHTAAPIGRMLLAQIQSIAEFDTRAQPCDAGYGGTSV